MTGGASYLGIGIDFFSTGSETQDFPLGSVVKDSLGNTFCYVKVSADLTKDLAYVIEADFEVKTALVSNSATCLGKQVCFAQVAVEGNTTAKYAFLQIAGRAKATFAADTAKSALALSSTTAGKLTGTSAANAIALIGASVTAAVDVSEEATGYLAIATGCFCAHAKQAS